MKSPAVITIDCHYLYPKHAAAYLLSGGDRAAFVDNNTAYAVPRLLAALDAHGLRPEQVACIIITHLHFDHASGTSALAARCPNAQVLCHPAAVRHLVDPSRLVASVKQVYGEARFNELYGPVAPIDAARVRGVGDGELLALGARTLTFLHTPGHARHHIAICDSASKGAFTGDLFGLMCTSPARHPQPCLVYSSPPTDFDPVLARQSIERLRKTGIERVYLAHFGEYTDLDTGEAQLLESLDDLEAILEAARTSGLRGEALESFCEDHWRRALERLFARWAMPMESEDWAWLAENIHLNALGLAHRLARDGR